MGIQRTGSIVRKPILDSLRVYALGIPWLGFTLQFCIETSAENLFLAFFSAISSTILIFISFKNYCWEKAPVSSFMILGFTVTQHLGPLLLTALEGKGVAYNLRMPYEIGLHALALTCSTAIFYWAYLQYRTGLGNNKLTLIIRKTGIFSNPSFFVVIVLGTLGAVGLLQTNLYQENIFNYSIFKKFTEGFRIFSALPGIYLLSQFLSGSGKPKKLTTIYVITYYIGITLIGIAINSRGAIVEPLTTTSLAFIIFWLLGRVRLSRHLIVSLAVILVIAIPTTERFARAMVIVRGERTNTPPLEIINRTIDVAQDNNQLDKYIKESNKVKSGNTRWSEKYLSSAFASRFCNLKFNDNSLYYSKGIESRLSKVLSDFYYQRISNLIPEPIQKIFYVSIRSKRQLNGTVTDRIYSEYSGEGNIIGNNLVGHMMGTDYSIFSYAYPLVFGIFLFTCFWMYDSLVFNINPKESIISIICLCRLYDLFAIGNIDSSLSLVSIITRDFWEPILLFAIVNFLYLYFTATNSIEPSN